MTRPGAPGRVAGDGAAPGGDASDRVGAAGVAADRVLYDGACGLCHGVVKRLVRWDEDGSRFRFAPLAGPTARALLAGSPEVDSVVVVTPQGARLVEHRAVRRLLARLAEGGVLRFRAAAALARAVPVPLGDALYRVVARARKRFTRAPAGACPLLPPGLAQRFDP